VENEEKKVPVDTGATSEEELLQRLEGVNKEDSTKGQYYYARKFKSCYQTVRRSLVEIAKARKHIGSERAVELTIIALQKALDDLE
jgi:hypothetical protein